MIANHRVPETVWSSNDPLSATLDVKTIRDRACLESSESHYVARVSITLASAIYGRSSGSRANSKSAAAKLNANHVGSIPTP